MKAVENQVFGRLTALKFLERKNYKNFWLCRCVCGAELVVPDCSLKSGNTTSCGCKRRDSLVARNKKSATRDGLANSPTGRCWGSMIRRCYAKKSIEYTRYGAIGITACEYLRATPLNVIILIGERPLTPPRMSIDRVDNLDGYHCGSCAECFEKGWKLNVRWATPKQQGRNQRSNRVIEINGERHCLAEWIDILGISKHAVTHRIYNLGWDDVEALTTPVRQFKSK